MSAVKLYTVKIYSHVYPRNQDNWGEIQPFDPNNMVDLVAQLPRYIMSECIFNVSSWDLNAGENRYHKAIFYGVNGEVYLRDLMTFYRVNIEPQAEYIEE